MRTIKILKNKFRLVHDLKNFEELPYEARVLGPKEIIKSQQLQGELYLSRGYIKPEELDENGCIANDPYKNHSTYFGVFDKHDPEVLLAGARFIHPTGKGLDSLQIHFDEIDTRKRRQLFRDNPNRYAEFSALVKRRGSPTVTYFCLLREMLRFSLSRNIDKWLFSMNSGSNAIIGSYFGPLMSKLKDNSRSGTFNAVCTTYIMDVKVALGRIQRPMTGGPAFLLGKNTIARFFASAAADAQSKKSKLGKDAHQSKLSTNVL